MWLGSFGGGLGWFDGGLGGLLEIWGGEGLFHGPLVYSCKQTRHK